MSLDVYLEGPERKQACRCVECWHAHERTTCDTYYSGNITHNLGRMASEAGIYEALWRPEEIGVTIASSLAPLLRAGLERLRADPDGFKKYDSPNGWGLYVHFVPFVEEYLAACLAHPDARVRVSR